MIELITGSGVDPTRSLSIRDGSNNSYSFVDDIQQSSGFYALWNEQGDLFGNIPQTVPGLFAWYRGDSLVTQSGGVMEFWGDRSGNGHILGFGDGTKTFQSSTLVFDNQPTVALTESQGTASYVSFPGGGNLGSTTIFAVERVFRRQSFGQGFEFGGRFQRAGTDLPLNQVAFGDGGNSSDFLLSPSASMGQTTIYTYIQSAENPIVGGIKGTYIYENGRLMISASEAAADNVATNGTIRLGHRDTFTSGDELAEFAEFIIYSGDLQTTSSQLNLIHQYLSNRYNIPLSASI